MPKKKKAEKKPVKVISRAESLKLISGPKNEKLVPRPPITQPPSNLKSTADDFNKKFREAATSMNWLEH